jgi:hypothetical protein
VTRLRLRPQRCKIPDSSMNGNILQRTDIYPNDNPHPPILLA